MVAQRAQLDLRRDADFETPELDQHKQEILLKRKQLFVHFFVFISTVFFPFFHFCCSFKQSRKRINNRSPTAQIANKKPSNKKLRGGAPATHDFLAGGRSEAGISEKPPFCRLRQAAELQKH